MHTLTIHVKDNVLDKILYLLQNLSDVEIVEDRKIDDNQKLNQVKGILKGRIKDPVAYQQALRNEWEDRNNL